MFTACFDAGGSQHDQRFLIMAGFISSADAWTKFDAVWRDRLSQDGISYFHMVEFAHSSKEFRNGWRDNKSRREKLLSELLDIIRAHAFRVFGCAIENKVLLAHLPQKNREEFFLDSYSLAGRDCASQVTQWCLSEHISTPVEFVFEDGDLGKGNLMKRLKEDGYSTPSFRFKKDRDTPIGKAPSFTPLQAADFLAYEIFVGCKNMEQKGYRPRWALEEFLRMPGYVGLYERENLEALDKNLTFYKSLSDNWRLLIEQTS